MLLVLCCEPVFCTLCRPIPNYSDGGILLSCCMGDMHVVGLDERVANYWEVSKEKSKSEIGNIHIRKAKFSKEKCTYWKSKMRNFKVGTEKYPSCLPCLQVSNA